MMNRDLLLTVAMSAVLAAWVTDHVALAFGLFSRRPRWRGVAAFVLLPTAPVFGFAANLWVRSTLWLLFGVGYGLLRWRAYA